MFQRLFSLPFLTALVRAIDIQVASSGGNASSPIMYGLMFEDINQSGDGGIYAELIQNRAFQGSTPFPSTIYPWTPIGDAALSLQNTDTPLSSRLPTSINVASNSTSGSKVGLVNPGWWGIEVKPQKYTGSFWALGSYTGDFTVKLQSSISNETFASLDIPSQTVADKWVEHIFVLEPTVAAENANNTFSIEFTSGSGSVNFNLISLFPPTYKNRPNGLRVDLMEALKALNPKFLRMPGGNNLEGDISHYPWRWNDTIGPLTERPGRPGTWSYQNTDGLGLIEYFHWCEDLEIEPLLAVWAGMYLGDEDDHLLTAEELKPWVQDTMNELEFLLGPSTSTYGAVRASLGYEAPFHLKYLEIGNEDNLPKNGASSYMNYRFPMYYEAISAVYPDLIILSSTGDYTAVGGSGANATWTDFHTYSRPDLLVSWFNKFDHASTEHKTLIGEYAIVQENLPGAKLEGVNWSLPKVKFPSWIGAVSEAIWSIGAERNGDKVMGMSYAPGLQNMNSYQWSPDLISFTALSSQTTLSTSYQIISLFAHNTHEATVPALSSSPYGPAYWVAGTNTISNSTKEFIFKAATYNTTSPIPFNVTFEGVALGTTGTLTVLGADGGWSANLVGGEEVVQRREGVLTAGEGGTFGFEMGEWEVGVLRV
ncbi:hypothetical protein HYALB_00011819 [Hymenoscyphus albidus]|uniref:non-reducing end alpha-L-arabinofuranosidase n=1 Tax=Hymenoscyphus albidus TaxID=595503 RepID=A0A9N9LQS2_9HELO|nr:hypothetical protein HYALB_00011819 [Hymenoscyphus albidus]